MMPALHSSCGVPPALCVLKMPLDRRGLHAVLQRMSEAAGVPCPDTALLDDGDMEALHEGSLGRPGPTNILSFPAPAGAGAHAGAFPGCLALSADSLEREAFLYGQDPAAYCVRLLAHGLAHLAGHEHGPEMREFEEGLTDLISEAAPP
jgi:probable rRNA maturation factor